MPEETNAFLFVWNSKYWPFEKIEPIINEVKAIGKSQDIWGIASHKKAKIGDRIFITRVNAAIKGIIASGTIISEPKPFSNYKGKIKPGVLIEFDIFLNPEAGQILNVEIIKSNTSSFQSWSPQSSGIQINTKIVPELEMLWSTYLEEQNLLNIFFETEQLIIEGTSRQLTQTVYERNRYARMLCLKHHGHSCAVCQFNFETKYGDIGKEFIHVHHLKQLSNIGAAHITNPVVDLRPVCPNCHAMLHKTNPPYTIEELQQLMR